MNNREYLTTERARELILQQFRGQTRVPTRQIVNHVEEVHCEGVRELSANEKQIVSDALTRRLRTEGLADNPERGYWSFQTTTETQLAPAVPMKAKFTDSKIKEVAECSWWRKTSPKRLAKKFNLTEDQVYELRKTREYHKKVEGLMLSQWGSLEAFDKWVKSYYKKHGNMNSAFGEHMGIDPKVVPVMVKNVRKAHADIAAGKAKAPKMIQNPRKNMNPNSERIIGSRRNSVYLYYDQEKRDSAESKGENVWECKIGMTIQELHTRIYQQAGTAIPAERLKIGLHIKTDKPREVEDIVHKILKVRGKRIEEAPGREWFLTSPSEVEEIYNFIGENSHESASSTLS